MSGEQQRRDEENADGGEQEIATRSLLIEAKRFYLDVKQNRRGRFLKIAELGAGGQKSRVLMSMSVAAELSEKLGDFVDYKPKSGDGDNNGEPPAANGGGNANIKTATIFKENRRYFLDLRSNQRGAYLRISQHIVPTGARTQIVLPAHGVADLKAKLADLLQQCGTDDMPDGVQQLPEPRSMRADNKTFYFDVGENQRGTFLRVSEVRPSLRTAITVPRQCWSEMRDILDQLIAEEEKATAGGKPAAKADE